MALHFHRPTQVSIPALRAGLRDQWQRIRAGFDSGHAIDSLERLYETELHDVYSAEQHLGVLVDEIWVTIHNEPLAQRVGEYAAAVRLHISELEGLLQAVSTSSRKHQGEAMQALVHETSRIAEECADNVRDAALLGAIQRSMHYLIADYGTVAAHAKALGRSMDAAKLAQHADENKRADVELSVLAKLTLNPQAVAGAPS